MRSSPKFNNRLKSASCPGRARPSPCRQKQEEDYDCSNYPHPFGCFELTAGVGQITGCLIGGPLAFDNATSKSAAKTKAVVSDVAGDADILIAPDLEAGNMIAIQLIYLAGADAAGLVLGARVPVILTRRADGLLSRLASGAMAQLFIHHRQEQAT